MEKRLFLAIALALVVLLSWSAFVSKTQRIDNKAFTSEIPAATPTKPVPSELKELKPASVSPASVFKFTQEKYDIVFIEPQAAIKEISFKSYQNYIFPLQYGFLFGDQSLIFHKEKVTPDEVVFAYQDKDKQIKKHFIFSKSHYNIGLEINVQNLSNSLLTLNPPLILGVQDLKGDQTEARLKDLTVSGKDKVLHPALKKDLSFDDVKFLSLRDRYFCAIIEPSQDTPFAFLKKRNAHEFEIGINPKELALMPGQQVKLKYDIYLGPQELRHITSIRPEWSAVMYYGTFDIVAHLLLKLLDFIFSIVHNWGITIIILSFLIYIVLYPLTMKQMHSMKQMSALQPRIEELRKAYKDNPQKLNSEIMKLYKENKINPFGGCLPLILQMPIFFALYQVLIRSVALKGAKFLWIKDLSLADRLFILPVSLPFLGNEVNILPILMAIGMFIQQKTSMSATSSGSAEQQKLMMILFPLMFGFIFYHMPSGLVLYWFTNSALMLFYQLRINTSTSLSVNGERSRTINKRK